MPSKRSDDDPDDVYANAYWYFLKTLKIISEDAERQCEAMGYVNVAWELQDDAMSWSKSVLSLPGGRLSAEQRDAINHFVAGLRALPNSVVNVDNVKEEHLRVMNSAPWTSLRLEARNLTKILDSETRRATSILWPPEA